MIRTIIVDDESLARERIRSLLAAEPDARVVAECSNGAAAVTAIEEHRPDLLFLDVQMPKLDGLEVLRRIRRPIPITVFVTAFDHHAIQAFDHHALDYLLKPFRDARFKEAFQRAKDAIAQRDLAQANSRIIQLLQAQQSPTSHLKSIAVKGDDRVLFIPTEEIDYIESARNYVILHVGKDSQIVRENLGHLEKLLNPREFTRVSRFALVNIKRIRAVEPGPKGKLYLFLTTGAKLLTPLSLKEVQSRLQMR
jgi:two-component system, LytTR family, response regulator